MEKHRITVFCIKYNKTAGEGATVLKSFPQPLTAAEEKYYVQKYTEGDLEAKHILIERNLRLVAHIVKKYQPPPEEMEALALKARFSQHTITRQELKKLTHWQAGLTSALRKAPWWKRLYARWIRILT